MLIRIFLILFMGLLAVPSSSHAEEDEHIRGAYGYNMINTIRERLTQALADNSRLEVEYSMLKQEFLDMQRTYQAQAGDLAGFREKLEMEKHQRQDRREQLTNLENLAADSESQVLLKKSQISKLNLDLIDLNERIRLSKLKLSDIEYANRQADMDKKLKNLGQVDTSKKDARTLDELKQVYIKSVEEEKKLLGLMKTYEQDSKDFGLTIRRLEQENKDLTLKIKQLESRREFKEKENALLRNKKLYHVRLQESQIWDEEQKKIELQKKVSELEEKFSQLDGKVNDSLAKQSQRRDILNDIIAIDQENQILKDRIYELNQKMRGFR